MIEMLNKKNNKIVKTTSSQKPTEIFKKSPAQTELYDKKATAPEITNKPKVVCPASKTKTPDVNDKNKQPPTNNNGNPISHLYAPKSSNKSTCLENFIHLSICYTFAICGAFLFIKITRFN